MASGAKETKMAPFAYFQQKVDTLKICDKDINGHFHNHESRTLSLMSFRSIINFISYGYGKRLHSFLPSTICAPYKRRPGNWPISSYATATTYHRMIRNAWNAIVLGHVTSCVCCDLIIMTCCVRRDVIKDLL